MLVLPGCTQGLGSRQSNDASARCLIFAPVLIRLTPTEERAKGKENKGTICPIENKARNRVDNVNSTKVVKRNGNSAEYIIARLKRDAATDTLAAALLGRIDPPAWPSSAPSRLLARLPLTLTLLMTPRGSGAD